jgi:hypothetical protein
MFLFCSYCGVFMPCKNCNIETHSHDYATADEAVFSLCQAKLRRVVHYVASTHIICCQATEWGRVMWQRHAFQQWCNNRSTVGRSISHVSDQGFIGETEARSWVVLGSRQLRKVRSWRRSDSVNWRLCVSSFQLSDSFQFRTRWVNWSKVKWVKVCNRSTYEWIIAQKNAGGRSVKILLVIWWLYVYCSTVILEACDVVRLVWFLCDKSMKNSGNRLRRLEWSAL